MFPLPFLKAQIYIPVKLLHQTLTMAVEDSVIPKDGFGNEVFQAKYISKQKPPPPSDHPSMKTYISTYPPLGQVTFIDQSITVFTALLEVEESRNSDPWQVSLFHQEGEEWIDVPMKLLKNSAHPTYLQSQKQAQTRLVFTTKLPARLPTSFTIKFRSGPDQNWNWAKAHQGIQDGSVLLKTITSQDLISSNLQDYIQGLNPILKSKNYRSQSPGTTLWAVDTTIEAANGENSTIKEFVFGLPWGTGKFTR